MWLWASNLLMTEPLTPNRKLASNPATRSPYFNGGLNLSNPMPMGLWVECHSSIPGGERTPDAQVPSMLSEYRASHHFSTNKPLGLFRTWPPSIARAAAYASLQESHERSGHAASEIHRSLSRDLAYCNFYDTFMQMFNRLFKAKPILIQGTPPWPFYFW